MFYAYDHTIQQILDKKYSEISIPKEEDGIAAAWDEDSFAVIVRGKDKAKLKHIAERLMVFDACILLGGGGLFQNSGLCIIVYSEISKEWLDDAIKKDQGHRKLLADAEATGIAKKLEKAGLKYYALSPSRRSNEIVFWLNPCEQHKYNSDWVTVKDLEDWILGKGKIPKVVTQNVK